MNLPQRIEQAIAKATGKASAITNTSIAIGGCINQAQHISLEDGRTFFIKTNQQASTLTDLFKAEFTALELLAKPSVIHVPEPIAYESDFIVMTRFQEGRPANDWQQQMGRRLAKLHQATKQDQYGFEFDTYLGTTRQINDWQDDWLTFWREQRIKPQLQLCLQQITTDDSLIKQLERLINNLDQILADCDEPAVLLHGDLWSGNAAANEKGEPVIFDPASYYGHREAEIGMMRLFGGFDANCEAAYQEVWPLKQGYEQRITLYRLYHELNHFNLFGNAYYQTCMSTLAILL